MAEIQHSTALPGQQPDIFDARLCTVVRHDLTLCITFSGDRGTTLITLTSDESQRLSASLRMLELYPSINRINT